MLKTFHEPRFATPDRRQELFYAVRAGEVAWVRRVLGSGLHPDTVLNEQGQFALHILSETQALPLVDETTVLEIVDLLVQYGATVDLTHVAGQAVPLFNHLHNRIRRESLVRRLLEHGASPNGPDNSTNRWFERPLHLALSIHHAVPARMPILHALLDHGADPRLSNHEGLSAFEYMMRDPGHAGDEQIVARMLDLGIDPWASNNAQTMGGLGCAMGFGEVQERTLMAKRADHPREPLIALAQVVRTSLEQKALREALDNKDLPLEQVTTSSQRRRL